MPQTLKFVVEYDVPADLIYRTLTDQMLICQFTRSLAVSEPQPGGKLEMFGATIVAEYKNLVENEKLEMNWKFKDWENYCDLIITFENFDDSCRVSLDFSNIAEHDSFGGYIHVDKIEEGWRQNIFKNIYMVFGYHLKDKWLISDFIKIELKSVR